MERISSRGSPLKKKTWGLKKVPEAKAKQTIKASEGQSLLSFGRLRVKNGAGKKTPAQRALWKSLNSKERERKE